MSDHAVYPVLVGNDQIHALYLQKHLKSECIKQHFIDKKCELREQLDIRFQELLDEPIAKPVATHDKSLELDTPTK